MVKNVSKEYQLNNRRLKKLFSGVSFIKISLIPSWQIFETDKLHLNIMCCLVLLSANEFIFLFSFIYKTTFRYVTQFLDLWYWYDMPDGWWISLVLFVPWYNLIRVRIVWFWWLLRTNIVQDMNTNFRRKNQFWHLMINYQKQICNANCDRLVNI